MAADGASSGPALFLRRLFCNPSRSLNLNASDVSLEFTITRAMSLNAGPAALASSALERPRGPERSDSGRGTGHAVAQDSSDWAGPERQLTKHG